VVVVGDGRSETARAYDRGTVRFTSYLDGSAAAPVALFDDTGVRWRAGEDALVADDGRRLSRLA